MYTTTFHIRKHTLKKIIFISRKQITMALILDQSCILLGL